MNKTPIYFGLWTAACMLVAAGILLIIIFPALWSDAAELSVPMSQSVPEGFFGFLYVAPYCVPAGIVAGVGWLLLHRGGRRPGGLVYGLFTLAILLVNHVLFIGIPASLSAPNDSATKEIAVTFLFHGWLTVPIALAGTWMFVASNNRRGAGA